MAGPQKVQELTTLVTRTFESPKYKLSKQATGIYSLKNQIAAKRKNKVTQWHGHVELLKAQLYNKNRIKFHLYSEFPITFLEAHSPMAKDQQTFKESQSEAKTTNRLCKKIKLKRNEQSIINKNIFWETDEKKKILQYCMHEQ